MARILIAEDNAVNQRAAQVVLQRAGYEVDVVWNGNQAVAACHMRNYDLVLMDCRMPEMDGLEATQHIRRLYQHQPVILAMTAYARAGYREKCLQSGMDDYLAKPYHVQQLLHMVRESLERSEQPN